MSDPGVDAIFYGTPAQIAAIEALSAAIVASAGVLNSEPIYFSGPDDAVVMSIKLEDDVEPRLLMYPDGYHEWGPGGEDVAGDTWLYRKDQAQGGLVIGGGQGTYVEGYLQHNNFLEGDEIAEPAAPAADKARTYVRDNGSGKTQLVVRFGTGAVQVLATEP